MLRIKLLVMALALVVMASILGCCRRGIVKSVESEYPIKWEEERPYRDLVHGISQRDAQAKREYYLNKARMLDAEPKAEFGEKKKRFYLLAVELVLAKEWEILRYLQGELALSYQEYIWGSLADYVNYEPAAKELLEDFALAIGTNSLTTRQLIWTGFMPETWPLLVEVARSNETMPNLRAMALRVLIENADAKTLLDLKEFANSKVEVYRPGLTLADIYKDSLRLRQQESTLKHPIAPPQGQPAGGTGSPSIRP